MRDRTILTIAAALIALLSARPFAGGWNDGSRLATVESLVDRHTFAIDDSIFVNVPSDCQPYEPGDAANQTGTLDRLFIGGRFYSDKSPVPAILMAFIYKTAQVIAGLSAHGSPKWFCWLMTVVTSGLAYVLAVRGMHRVGSAILLPRQANLAWVISFAIGTIALAYSRTVNNHIMLLGIVALLLAEMAQPNVTTIRLFVIGTLAGLGYTIDLGVGPVLFLGALLWLMVRAHSANRSEEPIPVSCSGLNPIPPRPIAGNIGGLRRWMKFAVVFALGAVPWLALHHTLNYAIAGTIGPANANPEYLIWPGSPFTAANMTGHWQHQSLRDFLVYSLELLFGQKGIVCHNQTLILALIAIPFLLLKRMREKPEILCALFWSLGTFAAYAAASNNYSGLCVSIRWFVPLLAPGFFLLALFLRERPAAVLDFLILSVFAVIWSLVAWSGGPWRKPPLIWLWIILGCGQICWCGFRLAVWFHQERDARIHLQPHHALAATGAGLRNDKINSSISTVKSE